jgi:cardiolipin synthase
VANTVGAAMTGSRVLGSAEADLMLAVGLALLALSVVAFLWPPMLAWPLALIGAWIGVSLLIRARHLHAKRRKEGKAEAGPPPSAREGVEPEPRRGTDG